MTPERLAEIRALASAFNGETVVAELLAEVDRLRAICPLQCARILHAQALQAPRR